ncbi:MAG: hypothetical protein R3240_07525, partial [Gammaproteobacteria bacterium]|nr:hypothetical protein [Gammaproteobacteria bacterium]
MGRQIIDSALLIESRRVVLEYANLVLGVIDVDKDYTALLNALQQASTYPHNVGTIELIETHISWVLLTGDYVYKIKKPVNMGFLDFSTLEKRHFFCDEELRLNKRLAPDYYLEVVRLTGTPESPEINGTGEAFEYAVKMQQFPHRQQLDILLAEG